MKLLTRKGYLIEEQDMSYMAETDTPTPMAPLQSAVCTHRIALRPRAGQKVLSLCMIPSFDAQHAQQRCVNEQGFSLPAEVRFAVSAERIRQIENNAMEKLKLDATVSRRLHI